METMGFEPMFPAIPTEDALPLSYLPPRRAFSGFRVIGGRVGFEPTPSPCSLSSFTKLDELAAGLGLEPRLSAPEADVLPIALSGKNWWVARDSNPHLAA
jgi:hypothetical protein